MKKVIFSTPKNLKPGIPRYEDRKKLHQAMKESFPNIPVGVLLSILTEEDRQSFKKLVDSYKTK